jgi:hypothetical protein
VRKASKWVNSAKLLLKDLINSCLYSRETLDLLDCGRLHIFGGLVFIFSVVMAETSASFHDLRKSRINGEKFILLAK